MPYCAILECKNDSRTKNVSHGGVSYHSNKMSLKLGTEDPEPEEEVFVDVNSLPLKPPQAAVPPERPVRRPWHPVMWDSSIIGVPVPVQSEEPQSTRPGGEYPHKQRIRNLRRLIELGKVKPTQETLIFFLCNKFAVSDDRVGKIAI